MTESPTGRRAARALTAVSCAALLAACGGGGEDDPPGRPDAGREPVASVASAAAGGNGEDPGGSSDGDGRAAAWPGGSDDRDVIAKRRVTLLHPEDAPASVRPTADLLIRSLTVRGRVATLRFTALVRGWSWRAPVYEGGTRPYAPTLNNINPGKNTDVVSAHLIDPVNLRRHTPLEDSEGEALATMNVAPGADRLPIDASWMFAAPPEGVDAVDVQVGSWPVFREVPVARR